VSEDADDLETLNTFVRERLRIPRGTFEYYGQSAGAVCEELRLQLDRRRRVWRNAITLHLGVNMIIWGST
jgi:hypothetical protein